MTEYVMFDRALIGKVSASLHDYKDGAPWGAFDLSALMELDDILAAPQQAAEPVAWRPKLAHPIPYINGAPRESDLKHWEGNMGVEIEYAYAGHPPAQPEQRATRTQIPDGVTRVRNAATGEVVWKQSAMPAANGWRVESFNDGRIRLHSADGRYVDLVRGVSCDECDPINTLYDFLVEAGLTLPAAPDCWCHACRPVTLDDMRMVLCPDCGNKRCQKANNHRNVCTGSNEPGQPGSAYTAAPGEVQS